MRIAIIGAGWFGCHMAMKLKDQHEVSIFDSDGIFTNTSIKNQNRLHLGFHYARNSSTRNMCKNTFERFINDYEHLLVSVPSNIYAIPERNSVIDFNTYIKIFDDYEFSIIDHSYLSNVSGAISVNEKYIDPFSAQTYFTYQLGNILKIKQINNINDISKNFDLVINCTNNLLNPIASNSFMQPCTIFVYEKINATPFDALTFVDGPLFSIFPFYQNTVTVSDVEYTPDSQLTIHQRLIKIEEKISYYYPEFQKKFKYINNLKAVKAKLVDMSDGRAPVITSDNNIINCFSGKIQGIYYLEDYVRELCEF